MTKTRLEYIYELIDETVDLYADPRPQIYLFERNITIVWGVTADQDELFDAFESKSTMNEWLEFIVETFQRDNPKWYLTVRKCAGPVDWYRFAGEGPETASYIEFTWVPELTLPSYIADLL
jgi:hypothetical protein